MALTDRQKVIALFNRLSELRELNEAAWNSSGKRWLRNVAKGDISLRYSKRLMIGPPVASGGLTVGQLQNAGVWGLYEMTDDASRPLYEETYDIAVDETLQQTDQEE